VPLKSIMVLGGKKKDKEKMHQRKKKTANVAMMRSIMALGSEHKTNKHG